MYSAIFSLNQSLIQNLSTCRMHMICKTHVHTEESSLDDNDYKQFALYFAYSDRELLKPKPPPKSKVISLVDTMQHKRGLDDTRR